MNKPVNIILGALLAILIIAGAVSLSTYNSLVDRQEAVAGSYANIETQLQRRADLIPNLLKTVKGYMEYEKEIIDSVTESREKLVNAQNIQEMAEANEELSNNIKNLMMIVENYPDLKASENFIQLQDELAGSENRISTARKDYNEAVRVYNAATKRFPGRIFAAMYGFEPADYFEASKESEKVPDIEF